MIDTNVNNIILADLNCERHMVSGFIVGLCEDDHVGFFYVDDPYESVKCTMQFNGKSLHSYEGVAWLPGPIRRFLILRGYDLDNCITDR